VSVLETHEVKCLVKTRDLFDFVDITDEVQDAVSASGLRTARVTVFSPGEGCSLVVNERESGLLKDIRRAMDRLGAAGPMERTKTVGMRSVVIPVVDGRLRLGTWQRLLVFELEEASDRHVVVQMVGE
jgi:thiamine phosphate synthase YjbQ (UPF0047 family)